jgi:hypothetical protein
MSRKTKTTYYFERGSNKMSVVRVRERTLNIQAPIARMHSSAALLNSGVIAGRGKQFPPDLLV